MFACSLFTSFKAFAEPLPFSLTNVTIDEKSVDVTGTITSFNNDEILNDITFHKLNDYVVYKLSIKNNIDKDITILSISDDNNIVERVELDKSSNWEVL